MAALADLCFAAPHDLREAQRLVARKFGSALVTCAPGWNSTHINCVLGLGLSTPADESILDEIAELYQEAGVQYSICLSSIALPDELHEWLYRRDFTHALTKGVLVRGRESLPRADTSFRIELADEYLARTFADVLVLAFGMPSFFALWLAATVGRAGWRHYLAFDEAEPVAAASMFIAGKVGVLQFAATLPASRKRGAQTALIARRVQDALESGCTLVVSETDPPEQSNPSFRNLRRMGFEVLDLQRSYHSPVP